MLKTSVKTEVARFLYECIVTRFGTLLEIVYSIHEQVVGKSVGKLSD